MNRRLEVLKLRKEALTLRADLERIELAEHLNRLRRPAEISYKGLRLVSLLRTPLAALLAKRFGTSEHTVGVFGQVARYAGYVFAGWRAYKGVRDIIATGRADAS